MQLSISNISIAWKLPLMIVGAGGLVGISIGFASYWTAAQTLESEAQHHLDALILSRKAAVVDYLGTIEEDLRFVASNPSTKQALVEFQASWNELDDNQERRLQDLYINDNPHPTGSKENLDAAADGSSYSDVHKAYHPWFREFLRERGYYDIFLFDLEGNLIYTVFKELDYATNLSTGKYRDTDLGNSFRAALKNTSSDLQTFFDFRPYAPSHGAPASFISTPIPDERGKTIGVLVFQMPIDRLNHVVQQTAGLGESGQSFLVGEDRLMRTDSRFTEESTILAKSVDYPGIDEAFEGSHGATNIESMYGHDAIAAYTYIDFKGTRWALLAEMARDEILAPAADLALRLIAITLIALLVLAAIGWYLARDVVKPLVQMVTAVDLLAKGERADVPGADRHDEIGSVGRSLETISQKGLEAARLRSALDSCSTMVLVANRQNSIIYVNTALEQMLRVHGSEIRQDQPGFDADNLVGTPLEDVSEVILQGCRVAENQVRAQEVSLELGGRRLDLTISPITNESNTFLGVVVEWLDRTVELSMQSEIDRIINAARQGNLKETINLDGVDGAYRELAGGMNELTQVVSHATDELAKMLSAMAEGDLDRRIEADFQGRFGDLKNHANDMASQLAKIVGDVKLAAGEISSRSMEVNSGTEDLAHRTEQAASNLEETAAATEQMSATVKQNAENAKEANQLAEAANRTANDNGLVVERAVTAMSGIEGSAQKITDIIGVIDEIAFQTNLLALNASVESARAGEAGKGFAVVAQEVRQLAQRSAQAANDIKALIQDSNKQVEDGVRLVNQAGEALSEIVGSIGKVTGIVREISSASEEQAAGVQEINRSINSMDEMTQQNSALVEESTAAARALSDQASNLNKVMAFFKSDVSSGAHHGRVVTPRVSAKPKSDRSGIKPAAQERTMVALDNDGYAEF